VTSSVVELVVIVLVALGLAFGIQAFIVKPYKIPSGSMEPTLVPGQRVLVDRITREFGFSPEVGEIVVFHPPVEAERQLCGPVPHVVSETGSGQACDSPLPKESTVNYIKRIVAGPGDEIFIRQGDVYRCPARAGRTHCAPSEFVREKDSYTKPCGEKPECSFTTPIRIPAGHWFMMGDNRGESDDSRFWGPVPTGWIVGDAFATYWPPGRIGTL
jgi:signal peptidase I